MKTGQNIILWIVDPSVNPIRFLGGQNFQDCRYFIPVFCFDPGLQRVNNDPFYFQRLINDVGNLRDYFRSIGSDLLVTSGDPVKMIPSLSRIFNAARVLVSCHDCAPGSASALETDRYYSSRTEEIESLLSMHSIDLEVISGTDGSNYQDRLAVPSFPEIHPGDLPANPGKIEALFLKN